MKRIRKSLRIITFALASIAIGLLVTKAVTASAEADEVIAQADEFITRMEEHEVELDTVSDDYSSSDTFYYNTEPDAPSIEDMDVWTLGSYLYGISELDTTRTLKLITYEGYGCSPLSYYVACCCWVRATEGHWGYDNLYQAFGGADYSYDLWMDGLWFEDWAVDYLRLCYMEPTYVRFCNGMECPTEYIYYEDGIYVWN